MYTHTHHKKITHLANIKLGLPTNHNFPFLYSLNIQIYTPQNHILGPNLVILTEIQCNIFQKLKTPLIQKEKKKKKKKEEEEEESNPAIRR